MKTRIDWFAFRSRPASVDVVRDALIDAIKADGLGLDVEFVRASGGWQGYACREYIELAGTRLGFVAWGGEHQRGWVYVSISGEGCGWICKWTFFDRALQSLPEFEHKRIDIAFDVYSGLRYEDAEEAWEAGGFDQRTGSRPKRDRFGVPERGRTFYVGSRTSDRYLRVYEKGLKLLSENPDAVHPASGAFNLAEWVRVELECKASDSALPRDIVSDRDRYFAGAYPWTGRLLCQVEGRRWVADPVDRAGLEVIQAMRQLRRQAGAQLATLLHVIEDPAVLMHALTDGCEHSPRLVKGGALLVSREDVERLLRDRCGQVLNITEGL